jgi:uncharacterized membrane protein YtjA (UPF0391 family)
MGLADADFVPRLRILFPGGSAFFVVSEPGTTRNFRSPTRLALHPMRDIVAPVSNRRSKSEVLAMLSWVVTFLIIALIAGILGFGGIAGASIEIAKVIFFIAVVLFLVSAVVGLARGRNRI